MDLFHRGRPASDDGDANCSNGCAEITCRPELQSIEG